MPAETESVQRLQAEVDTLQKILDHAYECIVVVDRDGYITRMNRTYEEFLGIPPGSALGRHVTEVIENTRMHIVVRTGVPEIGWAQVIKGEPRIVQRIPIVRGGQVVGAVGKFMFKDMAELRALSQRVGLLESKVELYEQELRSIRGSRFTFENIIGRSQALAQAKQLATRAAQSQAPILLLGETGTGKELFAHAIHQVSPRSTGPFVRVNCAAIPPDLLEAELFGFEEGAFTGARRGGKPGQLELAHRGTIFLDEIGDMPLAMQAKILRAVQEKEVERVGSIRSRQVDVRIISATNADLEQMVAAGQFREDLYYRLNVISIRLPPLRERREDIPLLVAHGLARMAEEHGMPPRRLSPELLALLQRYHWPGNVRELLNVLERLIYTVDATEIGVADLPPALAHRLQTGGGMGGAPAGAGGGAGSSPAVDGSGPGSGAGSGATGTGEAPAAPPLRADLEATVANAERQALIRALERAGGSKAAAARLLGIHRSTLYEKLRRHGLA